MIPESGSVSEFKEALRISFSPLVGEVYLRQRIGSREYCLVTSFGWWSHVVYEAYWCLDAKHCFRRKTYIRMSAHEWGKQMQAGKLILVGTKIPLEVVENKKMIEMYYRTFFPPHDDP